MINSAKLQRQRQNQNAYQCRTSKPPSPTEPQVGLHIPSSLHCRAAYKFRSTSHFINAYQGRSSPTLILGIWEPQYLPIILQDATSYSEPALENLDVLHSTNGHQLRLLEGQGHERRKLIADENSNGGLVRDMLEEIEARLTTWIIHDNEFEEFEGSEWEVMTGELALEWGAKVIHCLKDEVCVRQIGYAHYLEAYERGQLAWQSIDIIEE